MQKDDLELFFGVDKVKKILQEKSKKLFPLIAVEVASGSGSHLSKNANVTYIKKKQKKLISDDIITPHKAVFDYSTTVTAPVDLTIDGAIDGLAHSLEIYYGIDSSSENYDKIEKVCLTSIAMIVDALPMLIGNLKNIKYREIIGLATDLGGYALMLGGTNGAHLNSFSLIDIVTHGRACGILNPYYTVFFSTAIKNKLRKLANIYKKYIDRNYTNEEVSNVDARQLGEIVAEAMINFSKRIGFPTKLSEIEGFNDSYINKMIEAAKNPQLDMKLKNMPVPLSAELVDEYMRPVLEAAKMGDFSLIKNFK
jgi:alcohol dehydrogenase class IV